MELKYVVEKWFAFKLDIVGVCEYYTIFLESKKLNTKPCVHVTEPMGRSGEVTECMSSLGGCWWFNAVSASLAIFTVRTHLLHVLW